MKKIIIILIVSVTAAMIVFTCYVKSTLTPVRGLDVIEQNNAYISYEENEFEDNFFYSNDNMCFENLKKHSDLVVEVTCVDEGSQKADSILRKCKINKIVSGDYKDAFLYVYEPSYVSAFDYLEVFNGYLNMKKDNTYILFLKSINAPKDADKEYSRGYYPTSAMYGKYRLGAYETVINYQVGTDLFYDSVAGHESMLINDDQVRIYNDILSDLAEMLTK